MLIIINLFLANEGKKDQMAQATRHLTKDSFSKSVWI